MSVVASDYKEVQVTAFTRYKLSLTNLARLNRKKKCTRTEDILNNALNNSFLLSIIACLNCFCVSDPGVFKNYPATQVKQPMCLHMTSWRDLGADLPTVPPFFNSHFTRTSLYIPAPGIQRWGCDRQPRRHVFD